MTDRPTGKKRPVDALRDALAGRLDEAPSRPAPPSVRRRARAAFEAREELARLERESSGGA